MNKSKDSNKVYSISLSIILLAGIFFQIQLYPISFSQFAYGKDYNFVKEAGVIVKLNTTSPSTAETPFNLTWKQLRGDKVLMNLSDSNKTLVFITPIKPYIQQIAFSVTISNGNVSQSHNLIFTILADKPPVANAGMDRNISIQEICNPQNSSSPSLTPIILDGSQSRDDNQESLKYEWKQTEGPPTDIFNNNKQTANFEINLCKLRQDTSFVFNLYVVDKVGQLDIDDTKVFINAIDTFEEQLRKPQTSGIIISNLTQLRETFSDDKPLGTTNLK